MTDAFVVLSPNGHRSIQQWTDTDAIDIREVIEDMDAPKRRVRDVVNILEAVGVLERHEGDKNMYRWIAPFIRSEEEMEQALDAEEEQLVCWIELLKKRKVKGAISARQLAPLMMEDEETTLLALHVPDGAMLRTVHMPEEDAFAFNLTMPSNTKCKTGPKACLIRNDDSASKMEFVERARSSSLPPNTPQPTHVPSQYPLGHPVYTDHRCPGLDPLETLLKVLPKPPALDEEPPVEKASNKVTLTLYEGTPIQVSSDEHVEQPPGRVEALLHTSKPSAKTDEAFVEQSSKFAPIDECPALEISDDEQERPPSRFEALLHASTLC